jgi:iron complex outermembrane receptor protein
LIHEGLLWNPGYNAPLSNTNAWTMMTDINAVHYLNYSRFRVLYRASITTGLTGNWAMSEVTEFINRHEQFRAGAYFSYYRSCRRADEMQIMVREEVIDGRAIQPVGTIWYSLNLRDMISVKGCVSRNYRVPTFNDLYWTPGGNPDLKAETGWTEEMTVSAKFHGAMWKLNYSLTGYNRNVTNMITWVPNSSYWSPMNVNEVWSRGAEHRLRFEWRFGASARIILTGNADYVRSTYEKTDDPNDVALGKQLIYVPAWFGGSAFTFEGWKFFATYSYQYTDLRFTTRDHSEFVPGYGLHSAAVGYTLSRNGMQKHYEGNLFFRWNNIMNVDYQSVAWRPMPGRSFTMGLSLNFGNELPPRKNFKVRKT